MGKSPYYVNDEKELIWTFSAFTRSGAYVLAKVYRDKIGSEIVQEPFEREDGMWVFMVTNPFYEENKETPLK
jgi:hypothetical protein